ncbi:MAG TPA: hypothetical protein VME92_05060, partial [Acetobacteraceae bacterium]|nr:hypothetical protein [Acetobacteraceae bacterium]
MTAGTVVQSMRRRRLAPGGKGAEDERQAAKAVAFRPGCLSAGGSVLPRGLGPVQRFVGPLVRLGGARRIIRQDRDADACLGRDDLAAD